MASNFIKQHKVNPDFEKILSDFSKEILRNQPKDIYDFGIYYFKCLEEGTPLNYYNNQNLPLSSKNEHKMKMAPNKLIISNEEPDNSKQIVQPEKNNEIKEEFSEKMEKEPLNKSLEPVKSEHSIHSEKPKIQEENKEPEKETKIEEEKIQKEERIKEESEYSKWFKYNSSTNEFVEIKDQDILKYEEREVKNYDEWFNNHCINRIGTSEANEIEKGSEKEEYKFERNEPEPYDAWFGRNCSTNNYNEIKDTIIFKQYPKDNKTYEQWFQENSQ